MSSASTLILVSNSPAISLSAALICLNTPGLELMVSTVTLLSWCGRLVAKYPSFFSSYPLTTVYSISLSLAACSVRTSPRMESSLGRVP